MSDFDYALTFTGLKRLSKQARLRRAQIDLFRHKFRVARPFWKFLSLTSWLWLAANVLFWMFSFLFTAVTRSHPSEWMFIWFMAYMAISATYIFVVQFHGLVMRHWPQTMKVLIGGLELPCGDLIPGARVRPVGLQVSEDSDAKEIIPIEIIPCGYVTGTQEGLTKPNLAFVLGRANRQGASGQAQAGILWGPNRYLIPANARIYIAKEMPNWRLPLLTDLLQAEKDLEVLETSLIIDATETYPFEPVHAPAEDAFLRKELFTLLRREKRVSHDQLAWIEKDRDLLEARNR
jgi:hypothetical protein